MSLRSQATKRNGLKIICKTRKDLEMVVEMTIVLFIISLLILIIVPNLGAQRKHATSVNQEALVNMIQNQVELYHDDTGDVPTDLSQLEKGDYLTAKQVRQASRENITLQNGQAVVQ